MMKTIRLIYTTNLLKVFLLVGVLSGFSMVYGQGLPDIELTISSERTNWTKGAPAVVNIKIKNLSNERTEITSSLRFYLDDETSGKQGPTMKNGAYYVPFSFTKKYLSNAKHCQRDLDETNVIREGPKVTMFRDMTDVYLNGIEIKEFQVDLAGLCWAHQISSLYPMGNLFSEAKPGSSMLYFSIRFVTGMEEHAGTRIPISNAVESNRLRISIK